MTSKQIESIPSRLESDYAEFLDRARAQLTNSLENGDVVADMRALYGDFLRALAHTLAEYEAPAGTLEKITAP